VQAHAAGPKKDASIRMSGCAIKQLGQGDHGGSGAFALLHRESVKGNEHCGIDGAGMKKEHAQDLLDLFGVCGIENI
jgi:hypothetical protein